MKECLNWCKTSVCYACVPVCVRVCVCVCVRCSLRVYLLVSIHLSQAAEDSVVVAVKRLPRTSKKCS